MQGKQQGIFVITLYITIIDFLFLQQNISISIALSSTKTEYFGTLGSIICDFKGTVNLFSFLYYPKLLVLFLIKEVFLRNLIIKRLVMSLH